MLSNATTSNNSRRPLTPWELPSLLVPVHSYRKRGKKPKIERSHFPAVLGFVYRNRFAVSSQIQRRFGQILRSDRTARRHLEELDALGYLGVAPGRGVGPLFPKVYYVTGRGVRRLRQSLANHDKAWKPSRIDRRGRDSQEGYAADRIIHEILITEFLLALWQTVDRRPDLELLTVQRRSLAKHPALRVTVRSRPTRLVPDAMFLFRQGDKGMCCCFLELDNGTMNRKQIREKFERYASWSQSDHGRQFLIDLYRGHGANEPRPLFRLLIVARSRSGLNDDSRAAEFLAAARKVSCRANNGRWVTTAAALRERQYDDRPLEAGIWTRACDIESASDQSIARAEPTRSVRIFPVYTGSNSGDRHNRAMNSSVDGPVR
jgi:Replication-relaxation